MIGDTGKSGMAVMRLMAFPLLLFLLLLLRKAQELFLLLLQMCPLLMGLFAFLPLQLQRLLRTGANAVSGQLLLDIPLHAFGIEPFVCLPLCAHRRAEPQVPPVLQDELVDLVVLRLCAEDDAADSQTAVFTAFINAHPKRIFKVHCQLRFDFLHSKAPLFQAKNGQPREAGY